jgi:hypothetical protein
MNKRIEEKFSDNYNEELNKQIIINKGKNMQTDTVDQKLQVLFDKYKDSHFVRNA